MEEQDGSLLPPLGFRTSLHILSNRFLLLMIKQIVVSLMELQEMIQALIFTLKLSLLQAVSLNYGAISRQQSVLCDDISWLFLVRHTVCKALKNSWTKQCLYITVNKIFIYSYIRERLRSAPLQYTLLPHGGTIVQKYVFQVIHSKIIRRF